MLNMIPFLNHISKTCQALIHCGPANNVHISKCMHHTNHTLYKQHTHIIKIIVTQKFKDY